MTAVIRMNEQGAPTVLRYEQETIGDPYHDQVLVRQAAIGVNHADVDHRTGSAPHRQFSRGCHPIAEGDVIVVHAATGGVGTLVSRWAKVLGTTVIATVGSASKWEAARRTGADYVIATVRQPETSIPVHRRKLQRRTRNPQPVHA